MRAWLTRRKMTFLAAATSILFLSFSINIFGAMSTQMFLNYFEDSEALVTNQISCKGAPYSGQLLGRATNDLPLVPLPCDPQKLIPYPSQFGFQGRAYTAAYKVISHFTNIGVLTFAALAELSTALVSAFLFALLALWVRDRYGLVAASSFTLLVAMSPMVVGFARNLYWAVPLIIAPIVYIFYLYRVNGQRHNKFLFWLGLAALLYMRYLSGYEYITTITIMVLAVMAFFLVLAGTTRKKFVLELAIASIVSVISFSAAIATHIYSLKDYAGSVGRAAEIITERASERTTNSADYLSYPFLGFKVNYNEVYQTSNSYLNLEKRQKNTSELWASGISSVNYALLPVFNLPISLTQPFATYIQSVTAFVALLTILYFSGARYLSKKLTKEIKALYVGAFIGFIGFLSWVIMARSHSLVHIHINGILLYMPFALFGYMIIGIHLQLLWSRLRLAKK